MRIPPPGRGPNCPAGSSFNFSTGRCEAQPTCPSGAPPNSQGQCTTTTVVGRGMCQPGFSVLIIFGGAICGVDSGFPCPAGSVPFGTICQSDTQAFPACSSGNLNFSTGNCEITTTIPASCPQGTALSGNVCAGHPIPRGPQPG